MAVAAPTTEAARDRLRASRRYAAYLWLALTLFAVRVVAQPLSLVVSAPFLPPFDSWYSGVVPYPFLLASQVAILALLVAGARRVSTGLVRSGRRTGLILLMVGGVYFGSMALRLGLGTTILRQHAWFGRTIPAVFHLVLATYVLLYGNFQFRYGSND
jgi:hypothetical protein